MMIEHILLGLAILLYIGQTMNYKSAKKVNQEIAVKLLSGKLEEIQKEYDIEFKINEIKKKENS